MEFSFDQSSNSRRGSRSSGGAGSDRLQKAIERNRAKQRGRASKMEKRPPEMPSDNWSAPGAGRSSGRGARVGGMDAGVRSNRLDELRKRREGRTNLRDNKEFATGKSDGSLPVRKNPGRASEGKFTTEIKKRGRTAPADVGYISKARSKRVIGAKSNKLTSYATKAGWICCLLLLLQLAFSDRGIIDFYSKRSIVSSKLQILQQIKDDELALTREIELIKVNRAHQKKLVRDILGFISRHEYLILFPKEKVSKSI